MPVLPEPTTVYAAWGRPICGKRFKGTQSTPAATSYFGGWVEGTAVRAWVAFTTFLRTVMVWLSPLVSDLTWCLPSRAGGVVRHRQPAHPPSGQEALLHHLVEVVQHLGAGGQPVHDRR